LIIKNLEIMKKKNVLGKLFINKTAISKLSNFHSQNIFGGDPLGCKASKAGSCNADSVTKSGDGGGFTCQCPTMTCTVGNDTRC
jgi:hypothetical protein